MAGAVVSGILGKFGQCLFDLIRSEFDYLFCFDTNIQKLQTQLRDLKATRQGVQLRVVEARNNLRSVPEADTWLIKANNKIAEADRIIEANNKIAEEADRIIEANNKIAEADTIIESEARVQTGCLNGWCGPRYSLSKKAANVTPDLVHLHTEGIKYTQLSHSPPPPSIQALPSTRFKGFESRNLIVKQIIEVLKDDEINLVGLCVMGGVGKTTMVKHVAERVKEEKLFDEVAMAVVSQKTNLNQVRRHIAKMLGLKLDDLKPDDILEEQVSYARASLLRQRLLLDNKKILVILDDIWKEFDEDLEELGFPLQGGNKSCKILFTSRIQNLWEGIQNKRYIQLQVLVGDEPWHLFREKVGDCADHHDLLPLAKEIVNECGGLPLALVTIGRALTNKHNQHHWKNALRQLRTPCSASEVPAKVYQALYFSYNFLEDERAKKLFLRCCLFPEDYNIPIEDLVRYGIGLQWFEGIDKVDEVRDLVNVLVDQLKSCCLLLDGNAEDRIKMHDVVHDVAISIAAKDKHGFMTIHGAKSSKWPKATYELNTSISVIEIAEFPEGLRCSKLEFLLIQCWNSSLKMPSNFFEGKGELKVLDLRIMGYISLLSSSLQFLSNLLTLHLDHCHNLDNISVIGKLLNLEILNFRESNIEELPEEIGGLVNLKLLDLTGCRELKRIAPGVISALVQLQELYMGGCYYIWEREGKEGGENASLREFESLSNLNTLQIHTDFECLPRIPLFSKLTKYSICIGYVDSKVLMSFVPENITNCLILRGPCTIPLECVNSLSRSSAVLELSKMGSEDAVQELFREGVEEGLQHLKELTIHNCATPECFVNTMEWAPRTPNAIPPIFPILEKLWLRILPNLRKICHCQLPTGSFGKLKHLDIYFCDKIEEVIWNEKVEDDATNKMEFPALESMSLWNLPKLIAFCRGTGEIEFPQLKKLSLGRLPQLKWLFFNSSNQFSESMENHNATFISLFPHKVALPSLEELELIDLDNLEGLGHIPSSVDSSFSKLRKLRIEHCGKWLCVFPSQFLTRLPNLQELSIKDCSLLEKVVDYTEHNSKIFPLLKSLKLESRPQLNHISERDSIGCMYIPQSSILHIDGCDNLRFLFTQSMTQCIRQLQKLEIRKCKMMSAIVMEEDSQGEILVNNIEFTHLKILQLHDLQNLVSIFPKVTSTVVTSFEHIQNPGQSLFNEKVAFPSLEELALLGFQNMNEIWCNQLQTGSFNKLIKLYVSDCGSLRNMFSPFMARHLVHLERLVIDTCLTMEEVVAKEEDEEEEEGRINRTPLPKLEYLKLENLPELKSFCHVSHDWELPLVKDITVLNCPKMKTFSPGVICTPKLQYVFVKKINEWLTSGEGKPWLWINDLNQTIQHLIEKQQEEQLQQHLQQQEHEVGKKERGEKEETNNDNSDDGGDVYKEDGDCHN